MINEQQEAPLAVLIEWARTSQCRLPQKLSKTSTLHSNNLVLAADVRRGGAIV
jgi:hypothetical protein